MFAPLQGDGPYAKNLLSLIMRDLSQPASVRARCAVAILLRGTSSVGRIPTKYLTPILEPAAEASEVSEPAA